MATRGSYLIEGMKLYNHWDNYPSGAALMFYKTVERFHKIDLFSFIRANDRVERAESLTRSGEEYSYKVEDGKIYCHKVNWKDDDKLVLYSSGNIADWVNENIKEMLTNVDKPEEYNVIKTDLGYYTESQIIEEAKKQYKEGIRFTESGANGNGSSCFSNAFEWCNYLLDNHELNQLREKYLKFWSPVLAKAYNHETTKHFDTYASKPVKEEANKAP